MTVFWVAIGGAIGAVTRYGVGVALKRFTSDAAWATLTVNLLGSFAIGLLWTAAANKIPENQRLFLFTGVIGAFTTFSTFNLDAWRYVSEGKYMSAVGYLALSVLGGLSLVVAGCWLGERMVGSSLEPIPFEIEAPLDDE